VCTVTQVYAVLSGVATRGGKLSVAPGQGLRVSERFVPFLAAVVIVMANDIDSAKGSGHCMQTVFEYVSHRMQVYLF
jgi:hypothetical protein